MDESGGAGLPDVLTAGGDCVQCLWAGNDFELLHLDLASECILPAHRTGARIVVTLTDVHFQRLEDAQRIDLPARTAVFLNNEATGATRNAGREPAQYLVLGLPPGALGEIDADSTPTPGLGRHLLTAGRVAVYFLDAEACSEEHQVREGSLAFFQTPVDIRDPATLELERLHGGSAKAFAESGARISSHRQGIRGVLFTAALFQTAVEERDDR